MTTPSQDPDSARRPSTSRRRGLLVALAAVPVLAAGMFTMASTASAAPEARGEGRWGAKVCAQLQCSDDQKEELRAIFAEMREDAKADREAIGRLRTQMREEFAKDSPDEKRLRSIQAQIATHHNELASRRLDAMLNVHAALTPEQRAQFTELMDKHRDRKGHRGKGHRGKGKAKSQDY